MMAATFATADGWLLAMRTGITALVGLTGSIADGCGSAATGFAGFVDAAVALGRRGLFRLCDCGESSESDADAALSEGEASSSACDDDSVVVSVRSGCFGRSGFDGFGAVFCGPGELSDVEASPEDDVSSARAIPLPNPTATQTDSTKTATVNRNHQ